MEPVLKVRVFNVQSKFNEQVIVLVIHKTETISFKKLPVRDSTVTEKNLTPFLISCFSCLNLKDVI